MAQRHDESSPAPDDRPGVEDDATPAPAPLLELRDGLPPVVDTPEALARVVEAFRAGTGPVAIDAERASGYRYSARAYLVQLRREGSGTALVDPIAFDDLDALQEALGDTEWILHAATQDLACLAEVGLRPTTLFDTELAGRLLGYPRVGLATLVESVLGRSLRKEHSAVDWSTRPLPDPWLEYAALDVEALVELREVLGRELVESGKEEWARQEFAHLVAAPPAGPGASRGAAPPACTRPGVAARSPRCASCGRPATRSPAAATSPPAGSSRTPRSSRPPTRCRATRPRSTGCGGSAAAARSATPGSGSRRCARPARMDEQQLPSVAARYDGPPPPRAWADRDPVAAARLTRARDDLKALSEQHRLPVENILTPDYVRRLLWEPPTDDDLPAAVGRRLTELGARPWQVELTRELLVSAILDPPPEPAPELDGLEEPDEPLDPEVAGG